MAQWQTLTTCCQRDVQLAERLSNLYQRIHFPYRFRSEFAEWIESNNWCVSVLSYITFSINYYSIG